MRGSGKIIGIGLGPGDPELISLKALKALQSADCLVFHQAPGRKSHALAIAEHYITPQQALLPLEYPLTVEHSADSTLYQTELKEFYRRSEMLLRAELAQGRIVAILAEGDPLFYSSFMYLYNRLRADWPAEIIPGISSVSAASAALGRPLCYRRQSVHILPATLPDAALEACLAGAENKAFIFMKLGRHLPRLRQALRRAGLESRAFYVERASLPGQIALPLTELSADKIAPYFSMLIIPGLEQPEYGLAADSAAFAAPAPAPAEPPAGGRQGKVSIISLGPGRADMRSLRAAKALREADAVLGYEFYLEQGGPYSENQQLFPSGNGEELARARQALALARAGRHAALLSSGDAGIYGMAAAFLEVYEEEQEEAAAVDIAIEPGISAAFAASAHFGAPLGHDFAVISLSDNLKPWAIIAARLQAAAKADMAMALYNPVSQKRRAGLAQALALLRQCRPADIWLGLAHNAGRPQAEFQIIRLGELKQEYITSRTVILIGSTKTRCFRRGGCSWLYTPRHYR